jgi:hypothetical protein
MKMNNGMKTTEEEQQQNEIKLAYKRNGMDKQNCPKGVQKHWQDSTKTLIHKKLAISVKTQ